MKTLSAKVLDPKHLELFEALPQTSGDLIQIVVADITSDPLTRTDDEGAASDHEVELAAVQDVSEDFLSEEELSYYLELDNL